MHNKNAPRVCTLVPFIPSAADSACSHLGKVRYEVNRTKVKEGIKEKDWSPMTFENEADLIDETDRAHSDDKELNDRYTKYGRPYLVSCGYSDGIKYIFTMSPIMVNVLGEADFIQCDITYDDCSEYPYIFNAVAFNRTVMEWMVVGRLRMNKQTADAYCLAFKKLFSKCSDTCSSFGVGESLLGVVTDWSDAEINGLKMAIGKENAEKLLKGCSVHWQHLCHRISERITSTEEEQCIFLKITNHINKSKNSEDIVACFEALCSARSVTDLLKKIPTLCSSDDAHFVDSDCDWSKARHWAQWWTRARHLKMLSSAFSLMNDDIWSRCPSTTNAVERKNKDCKSDSPNSLKATMIKVYKIDKVFCLKHITAEKNLPLSYHSNNNVARQEASLRKQKQRKMCAPDKKAQYGPPDRSSNFISTRSLKRKNTLNCSPPAKKCNSIFTPNPHPEVLGKTVRMKFENEKQQEEWYDGIIVSYNGHTTKYGIYFPCDQQTVETFLDDEDMEICSQ